MKNIQSIDKEQQQELEKIAEVLSGKFTIGKDKTIWYVKNRSSNKIQQNDRKKHTRTVK